MLCKYRDILGKVGEGFHVHLAGVAIFDILGTIAIAFALSRSLRTNTFVMFLAVMAVAILAHRLFCVDTTFNKLIFGPIDVQKSLQQNELSNKSNIHGGLFARHQKNIFLPKGLRGIQGIYDIGADNSDSLVNSIDSIDSIDSVDVENK